MALEALSIKMQNLGNTIGQVAINLLSLETMPATADIDKAVSHIVNGGSGAFLRIDSSKPVVVLDAGYFNQLRRLVHNVADVFKKEFFVLESQARLCKATAEYFQKQSNLLKIGLLATAVGTALTIVGIYKSVQLHLSKDASEKRTDSNSVSYDFYKNPLLYKSITVLGALLITASMFNTYKCITNMREMGQVFNTLV